MFVSNADSCRLRTCKCNQWCLLKSGMSLFFACVSVFLFIQVALQMEGFLWLGSMISVLGFKVAFAVSMIH